MAPGNGWAKRTPYLIAVGANPEDACKTNGLPYYAYDTGLSVMTLTIEAEHQGLRVHQMAGWNEEKAKKALGFPSNYRIVVVFALGYEGEARRIWDKPQERVKERLAESRKRNPQTDNSSLECSIVPERLLQSIEIMRERKGLRGWRYLHCRHDVNLFS